MATNAVDGLNREQRRHPDALLYSVEEAARILGFGTTKFRELLADGVIQTKRVGRRVLVPRAELERFAADAEAVE
jgi:excisionase family DNA binding protein